MPGTGADGALSHTAAAGMEVIELAGLAAEDAADLVLLRNSALTGDDLARLLDRARGNPLLLEELRLRRAVSDARQLAARPSSADAPGGARGGSTDGRSRAPG